MNNDISSNKSSYCHESYGRVDAMTAAVDGVPIIAPAHGRDRRERIGWYFYSWADHAFFTTVLAVFIGPYLTSVARVAADRHGNVHPLGVSVAAGSYYPYLVSLSVFMSIFALPVVGAIADRSRRKRHMLAAAAFLGAATTCGFALVTGGRYLLGGALFLVANIALNAAGVVYNSFLPTLADADHRDAISSRGWSFGYLGGGLHLALCLVAVAAFGTTGTVARWAMVSAGLWWAAFTLLPLRWLRDRPPADTTQMPGSVLVSGFRQLGQTLRHLRAYPLTLLFLCAFLIYNDGIQTVISLASTYGSEELGLGSSTLAATILIVQFVAFGGAVLLGAIAARIGARKAILGTLVAWAGLVIAAFWLPAHAPAMFMVLGAGIGLVLGGSQALSRSLFSQLIPAGREAEYFGFYSISDKGTSWLGPLLFGAVYQATTSYRLGIISLVAFFVVGFVALLVVPIRRAVEAVGNTPPRLL